MEQNITKQETAEVAVKENKLETMPILKLIFNMSLPAMFSMLVQSLYNVVDSVFVAQLGENALTAVSLAFPVQNLLSAVAVGTGVGVNSLISRRLGEKRDGEASLAATHGIFLGAISSVIFMILGMLFTRTFFSMFTSDPEVVQFGCDYVYIVTGFCFGMVLQVIMEKMIQSTGNMFYPMISQLVGAVTNIVLDPIMIFGLFGFPAMGVRGAAVATVIGQILGMSLCLYVVLRKDLSVKISFKDFRVNKKTVRDIYSVGFPSILMQSIGSLLTTLLNGILITFSGAAVSVLGVYYKLQSFVFMPVFGLTQGLMPIMGYNYGAQNKKRMTDTLKYGTIISLVILTTGLVAFQLFPRYLLMLFNASEEMMSIGLVALRIMSICFVFAAVNIVFSTFFQALGNGIYSLYMSILRQLAIILPLAYIFSKLFGLNMVWTAFPLSEFLALVFAILLMRKTFRDKVSIIEG